MPQVNGHTTVVAPIGVTDTLDSYPTHRALWGHGGWREVEDIAERDLIPDDRCSRGMNVVVRDDGSGEMVYYILTQVTPVREWFRWRPPDFQITEGQILDLDGSPIIDLDGESATEPPGGSTIIVDSGVRVVLHEQTTPVQEWVINWTSYTTCPLNVQVTDEVGNVIETRVFNDCDNGFTHVYFGYPATGRAAILFKEEAVIINN